MSALPTVADLLDGSWAPAAWPKGWACIYKATHTFSGAGYVGKAVDLRRRHIDRKADMLGPPFGRLHGGTEHQIGEFGNEALVLGDPDEFFRRNEPEVRMLPARQRFKSRQIAVHGADSRLEIGRDLTIFHRLGQPLAQGAFGCKTSHIPRRSDTPWKTIKLLA